MELGNVSKKRRNVRGIYQLTLSHLSFIDSAHTLFAFCSPLPGRKSKIAHQITNQTNVFKKNMPLKKSSSTFTLKMYEEIKNKLIHFYYKTNQNNVYLVFNEISAVSKYADKLVKKCYISLI